MSLDFIDDLAHLGFTAGIESRRGGLGAMVWCNPVG